MGTFPNYGLITNATLALIDDNLDLTGDENPEIKQRWYAMGLFCWYGSATYNVTAMS
jgi:hypothetical protein